VDGFDIEVWIVGAGPLKSRAVQLQKKYNERIEIKGFVQPHDLPEVYKECDILCAPSLHDGWGLVVVEGMAAGMPVISTKTTGAAIDLLNDECGWVAPPGNTASLDNALRRAAALDISAIRKMGAVARLRAQAYDVRNGCERFTAAALDAMRQAGSLTQTPCCGSLSRNSRGL
jgi:glycosyltransferase involved in cell wall biosynthesis